MLLVLCARVGAVCTCVAAGSTLTTVGGYQKRLGGAEREFLHIATANFLTPLRNFLEGDWRTMSVSPSRNRAEFCCLSRYG